MKSTFTLLLTALASTLVAPATARQFEGTVLYNQTAGKRTVQSKYEIKEDHLRMTMEVGNDRSIIGLYDAKLGEMYMLMPEQKMYMVFGGMKEVVDEALQREATLEETGRTEKIAGYTCTEYVFTSKDGTIELWGTKGLGRYISFADVQKSKGQNATWARLLAEKEMFPLRTIVKNRKGKVTSVMEATAVDTKKLDPALFEIPADYKRFEMPNLGGLLKGLGG